MSVGPTRVTGQRQEEYVEYWINFIDSADTLMICSFGINPIDSVDTNI